MKSSPHNTSLSVATTLSHVVNWSQQLVQWYQRIAPRFACFEPRQRALTYRQKDCCAPWSANAVGNWSNTLVKPLPLACSACSPGWCGTLIWCAMICGPLPPFTWVSSRSSRTWMKAAFPNKVGILLASNPSIAAALARWNIARSGCFSLPSLPVAIPSLMLTRFLQACPSSAITRVVADPSHLRRHFRPARVPATLLSP